MRQVSHAYLPPRFLPGRWYKGKPLSLEMIRSGMATTYEQAGAEYGKWGKDHFVAVEQEAK
jgi:endonuclease YncB( thermonuclease family)